MDATRPLAGAPQEASFRMTILWDNYVFRRGSRVQALWDDMFVKRPSRFLYITGCGFDVRVTAVLQQFLASVQSEKYPVEAATLALIEFSGYELDDDLLTQT